jgi:hypothetical protein
MENEAEASLPKNISTWLFSCSDKLENDPAFLMIAHLVTVHLPRHVYLQLIWHMVLISKIQPHNF